MVAKTVGTTARLAGCTFQKVAMMAMKTMKAAAPPAAPPSTTGGHEKNEGRQNSNESYEEEVKACLLGV